METEFTYSQLTKLTFLVHEANITSHKLHHTIRQRHAFLDMKHVVYHINKSILKHPFTNQLYAFPILYGLDVCRGLLMEFVERDAVLLVIRGSVLDLFKYFGKGRNYNISNRSGSNGHRSCSGSCKADSRWVKLNRGHVAW